METLDDYVNYLGALGLSKEEISERVGYLTGTDPTSQSVDFSQSVDPLDLDAAINFFGDSPPTSKEEVGRQRDQYEFERAVESQKEREEKLLEDEGRAPQISQADPLISPGIGPMVEKAFSGQGLKEAAGYLAELGRTPGQMLDYWRREQDIKQSKRKQYEPEELQYEKALEGAGGKLAELSLSREEILERAESAEVPQSAEAEALAYARGTYSLERAGSAETPMAAGIGRPTPEYDQSVEEALSYARGEKLAPPDTDIREMLVERARPGGDAQVPEVKGPDPAGTIGRAAGRLFWGTLGLADLTSVQQREIANTHARETYNKALEAKQNGLSTIKISMPPALSAEPGMGRPYAQVSVEYNVDDLLNKYGGFEELDENKRETERLASAVNDALDEQREHMDTLLAGDPDLFSNETRELWRQNLGDVINGLAQFAVYGSGISPTTPEEQELRGFAENFAGLESQRKAFGMDIGANVIAGTAKVFTNPMQTLQTEGPTMAFDLLAYTKALKAAAKAGKLAIPDRVMAQMDRLDALVAPVIERINSSDIGQLRMRVKRLLDDSAANVNKHAEALASDILREAERQRGAVDNVIQTRVIPELKSEYRVPVYADDGGNMATGYGLSYKQRVDELRAVESEAAGRQYTPAEFDEILKQRVEDLEAEGFVSTTVEQYVSNEHFNRFGSDENRVVGYRKIKEDERASATEDGRDLQVKPGLRLQEPEGVYTTIRDVPVIRNERVVGTRPEVKILESERELFEEELETAFSIALGEANLSRAADAKTVRSPSGLGKDGNWRYAKTAKSYDLTGPQLEAWSAALNKALPALRKARKIKDKELSGKRFGSALGKLRSELKRIGEQKGEFRPAAPEVVEARLRKEARAKAAQKVINKRSPWGRLGDEDLEDPRSPIETKYYTSKVVLGAEPDGSVTVGRPEPLDLSKQQFELSQTGRRLGEGDTYDEMTEEFAKMNRSGDFKTSELADEPATYVVTPYLDFEGKPGTAGAEAKRAIQELVDSLAVDAEDAKGLFQEIEANLARSMDPNLPEILRSKSYRVAAADKVASIYANKMKSITGKEMPRSKYKQMADDIERQIEESQAPVLPRSEAPGNVNPENLTFEFKTPDGIKKIDLLEVTKDIIMNTDADPKLRRQILAESLAQTARRAGIRRAQKFSQDTFKATMDEGLDERWLKYNIADAAKLKVPTKMTELMRSIHTYLTTGSLPAVLRADPSSLATALDKLLDGDTFRLPVKNRPNFEANLSQFINTLNKKEDLGVVLDRALERRLENMSMRLKKRYTDFSGGDYNDARSWLGVDDTIYTRSLAQKDELGATKAAERRRVDIDAIPLTRSFDGTPVGSVYLNTETAEALSNFAKANKSIEEGGKALAALTMLKSNLTARSATTLKNNLVSNYFLQAISRGEVFHPWKLGKAVALYKKWETDPKSLSTRNRRKLDAISRTAKVETDLVDAEINAMNKSGLVDRWFRAGHINSEMAKNLRILDAPGRTLEEAYRFSDVAFKVEEGLHGFDVIEGALSDMSVGNMLELEIGKGKLVTLKKTGTDQFVIGKGRGRKFEEMKGRVAMGLKGSLSIGSSKMDDVIARAAMRTGDKKFFDYFDVADVSRKLRTSNFLTLASPFYTWLNKAMDIPGVKKGLVSEIYSGGPHMWTNDALVQSQIAGRAAKIAATAHASLAASSGEFTKEEADSIRKAFGWGTSMPVRALGTLEDGMLKSYNLAQANPFSATDLAFRGVDQLFLAASGLYGKVAGRKSLEGDTHWLEEYPDAVALEEAYYANDDILEEGLDKETLEKRKEVLKLRKFLARKGAMERGLTLSDGLDLVGLAGSPILELWNVSALAEQRQRPVSWAGIGGRLAGLMAGGAYYKTFDALIGGLYPTLPITTRYDRADPINGEEQQFLEWAIKSVTGLGWDENNFKKRNKQYFKKLQAKWKATLTDPMRPHIKNLKKRAFDSNVGPDDQADAYENYLELNSLSNSVKKVIEKTVRRMALDHKELDAKYSQ